MNYILYNKDCFDVFPEIPDESIDLVLTDPPYGTTACKWDSVIPLEPMWEHLKRITKKNGAIVLMASQPFSSVVVCSNLCCFAHSWIWNKRFAANFAQAKRQPLKDHEEVLVFCTSKKQPRYMPQMMTRDIPIKIGKNVTDTSGAIPLVRNEAYKDKVYTEKYPTSTSLTFSCRHDKRGLHPTQKPVALMEYLIKTYTNEGETVLDFTMGSGTTGVACGNLNRNFIGIEKDTEHGYFRIAETRIAEAYSNTQTKESDT